MWAWERIVRGGCLPAAWQGQVGKKAGGLLGDHSGKSLELRAWAQVYGWIPVTVSNFWALVSKGVTCPGERPPMGRKTEEAVRVSAGRPGRRQPLRSGPVPAATLSCSFSMISCWGRQGPPAAGSHHCTWTPGCCCCCCPHSLCSRGEVSLGNTGPRRLGPLSCHSGGALWAPH